MKWNITKPSKITLLSLVLAILCLSCRSYQTVHQQGDPLNKIRSTLLVIQPGDQVRVTMKSGIRFKGLVLEKEHDRIAVLLKKPRDQTAVLYFNDMKEAEKKIFSLGKTSLLIASLATLGAYIRVLSGS